MGKYHEANEDYSRIIRNDKFDPNIYMHRGSVLFLLEEYGKANKDLKMSLEHTPDQPVAMHYQAGRLREAVVLFQEILELKPDYTEVIQSLGQAYRELGEFDLAIENFNKALSVNSTDARSYHYKGHLQYYHGDANDSLQSFKNYTEQPGIQPHIKDIETPSWDSLSAKIQYLLCNGYRMGSRLQYHDAEGYLGNERVTTALGLASLQISQAVIAYFNSPKTYRTVHGKKLTWKTAFDIAVKWQRLVDANEPILWLDQLPVTKTNPSSFVHHINLIRGDKYNIQYINYLRQVVDLMKKLVLDFTNAMATTDYKAELEDANDYSTLMKTIMSFFSKKLSQKLRTIRWTRQQKGRQSDGGHTAHNAHTASNAVIDEDGEQFRKRRNILTTLDEDSIGLVIEKFPMLGNIKFIREEFFKLTNICKDVVHDRYLNMLRKLDIIFKSSPDSDDDSDSEKAEITIILKLQTHLCQKRKAKQEIEPAIRIKDAFTCSIESKKTGPPGILMMRHQHGPIQGFIVGNGNSIKCHETDCNTIFEFIFDLMCCYYAWDISYPKQYQILGFFQHELLGDKAQFHRSSKFLLFEKKFQETN